MREGFLVAVALTLAGAGPALAQMPYSYYGGYPGYYGAYPVPYGTYEGYYGYLPPSPPVMAPPAPWAYQRPAPAAQRPPAVCWPPPCQELPPSSSPPPAVVPGDVFNPSACAPLEEPAPGKPLRGNRASDGPPGPPPTPAGEPEGYRWYGAAEFLYVWMKQAALPPLAATGPLGAPGTAVLLDRPPGDVGERLGARATLGRWLDGSQRAGIEVSSLQLFQRDVGSVTASAGTPPLAVPFFNAATGAEDAVPFAAPGTQSGRIAVEEVSRLWSAEANLRVELSRSCWHHVDLLGGFHALGFDEGLTQTDTTTRADGSGTTVSDRFGTRNLFLGGQVGAEAEVRCGRWFGDVSGKIALGDNHQVANVNGTTLVTSAGGAQSALPGGLFALPGNSGRFSRDELTFLPQAGVHVGYQVAHHTRLFAGYDLLYLANVARPGDQLDRSVSPGPSAGAAFAFRDSDLWVQGVSLGLEFRY
jgi:hypothetical protein